MDRWVVDEWLEVGFAGRWVVDEWLEVGFADRWVVDGVLAEVTTAG